VDILGIPQAHFAFAYTHGGKPLKPLDTRLLSVARAARSFLVAGALVALVHAVAIVAFAYTVAVLVTTIINGASSEEIIRALQWFALAVLGRGLSLIALDSLGVRAGAISKSELREALMSALVRHGAAWLEARRAASLATLMGQGLDALDNYFGKYLPQLILAAVVTPVVVIVLYTQDLITGIAVTITLPLIPLFMALVGWVTQSVQQKQWEALHDLATGFLDTIEGLATLKIFGRHHRQRERIHSLTSDYRARTMKVLRVSFLSSFVLELAASLSVAVVAVSIGIRLIDEAIPLSLGLFVLVLVPEVFLPLRAVGAQFHAASEGLEAATRVFEILEDVPKVSHDPKQSGTVVPGALQLREFRAYREGRPLHQPLTFTVNRGDVVALAGPSGAGKSSCVDALLGFAPYSGTLGLKGTHLNARGFIAWAPQAPALGMGTIAANVALGDSDPSASLVRDSLALAGASELDPEASLGVGGEGLSGGQAQRVGLARAYYRALQHEIPFLVLDEVSSALDSDTERRVIEGILSMASRGYGVLLVSHREALLSAASTVVRVEPVEALR
jgi:ATP-binding cassette, subfamily C, bacterial CydD